MPMDLLPNEQQITFNTGVLLNCDQKSCFDQGSVSEQVLVLFGDKRKTFFPRDFSLLGVKNTEESNSAIFRLSDF